MKWILLGCLAMIAVQCTGKVVGQESFSIKGIEMKTTKGETVSFEKYTGKVVMFVNVASRCGYTKQYKQLQELHEKYADQGLVIVGIPCNQFMGQEPGTDEEIAAFCKKNYGVEFDLMSKVDVKGDQQCDLYKQLTGLELSPAGKGPVKWNFEKIIVDRSGTPIARFRTKVKPDSKKVLAVIKKALADKGPGSSSQGAGSSVQDSINK